MPDQPGATRRVIGFAHRGGKAHARENTLGAFTNALAMGATGLESDVWLTADGVPVLAHDGVLSPRWRRARPGDRPRRWRRAEMATMRRRDLPEHIPGLADLYEVCGTGFDLSLDVKDPAAAGPAMAVAAEVGALRRLWLCSPSRRLLRQWRAASTDVRLVDSVPLSRFRLDPLGRIAALEPVGADALNVHQRGWLPDHVAAVHATGRLAFAWDAQRPAVLDHLVALGIDAVFSDHVDRMMAALRRPPLGPPPLP